MAHTQNIFAPLEANDSVEVERLLAADPGLVNVKRIDPEKEGQTPLQIAAMAGDLAIVRLLVQHGAEVYDVAQWGYPALWHGDRHQHIVDYFLGEAAEKAAGTHGIGVDINLAARAGWVESVKKHLAVDPLAVHRRGVIGETPLHWAAHNGHAEIVTLLLDAGADIEADEIDLYGGKPLAWAAEHEAPIVEILLGRGANPNSRNLKNGRTPLIHCACQHNDCAECADLLIKAGADIAVLDNDGKTALDHAREGGRMRLTELLSNHQAG